MNNKSTWHCIHNKTRHPLPSAPTEMTLLQVKQHMESVTGIPAARQTLMFAGMAMRDDKCLMSRFGVKLDSRLMMMGSPASLAGASAVVADSRRTATTEHPSIHAAALTLAKMRSVVEEYRLLISTSAASNDDQVAEDIAKTFDSLSLSTPNVPIATPEDLPLFLPTTTTGEKCDRMYRYAQENVMRRVLDMDLMDVSGDDALRSRRRDMIQQCQRILQLLDRMRALLQHRQQG